MTKTTNIALSQITQSSIPLYTLPTTAVNDFRTALQEDGHHIWGFVVYRSTYKSDADWDEFIRRLSVRTRKTLELYQAFDLIDSHHITVFEDSTLFDGATTSTIREHFKQWVKTAVEAKQGPAARKRLSVRYQYCIQVDKEALESVVYSAPEPENVVPLNSVGYVNLINAEWEPYDPLEYEDEEDRLEEPPEEPIEGCTLHDIGWMRVLYHEVMLSVYDQLRGYCRWETQYRRPPELPPY